MLDANDRDPTAREDDGKKERKFKLFYIDVGGGKRAFSARGDINTHRQDASGFDSIRQIQTSSGPERCSI